MSGPTSESSRAAPLAPHPILHEHYAMPDEREPLLRDLFDATAAHYDWLNHILSLGSGNIYRGQALKRAGLRPGMRVADVACGTGALSERAARLVGSADLVESIDPSEGMRLQAHRARNVIARAGTAEDLPLADSSVDFLVMGYALRHVRTLRDCFAEFHRVVAPGGRVLILEITSPTSGIGRALAKLYLGNILPTVGGAISRDPRVRKLWNYHWDSIEQCVPPSAILEELKHAGFVDTERVVQLGIFSEYRATRPA